MQQTPSYNRRIVTGVSQDSEMSKSVEMIISEAERLGIEWLIVPNTTILELTHDGDTARFHRRIPPQTSSVAAYCCVNKQITRNLLKDAGVTVSPGYFIVPSDTKKYRKEVYSALSKPLVVKPTDRSLDANVTVNITSFGAYERAVARIYADDPATSILVEEQFIGDEFRIVCTKEKVISIIKRVRPYVVGDGFSTIADLAKHKSEEHLSHLSGSLKPLLIDEQTRLYLSEQGLTSSSVPKNHETVYFQSTTLSAIGRGGDTVEVLDEVHPSIHEIAVSAIQSVPGLAWGGIDFMCNDHTAKQTKNSYRLIEINASPELAWQEHPAIGESKNVIYAFLSVVFPSLRKNNRTSSVVFDGLETRTLAV